MTNETRNKLVELILGANTYDSYGCMLCEKDEDSCERCNAEHLADYLIANDVGMFPPTNIENKCGSCIYARPVVAFGSSRCYVNCTNKEHIDRFCKREISTLRQRTHPACKSYKRKEMRGGNGSL